MRAAALACAFPTRGTKIGTTQTGGAYGSSDCSGGALFYIPKRLIPSMIALGAVSFTMDSLPFTPQIQDIIPTKGRSDEAASEQGSVVGKSAPALN